MRKVITKAADFGTEIRGKEIIFLKAIGVRIRSIVILLAALVMLQYCGEQHAPLSTLENMPAIDSLVQREISRDNIPGAVVQVQKGDSILHQKAYGYAQKYSYGMELLENPQPMTTHHLFDLASLTKVCATTFGIMLLVDEDKIELEDPIHTWLPEFTTGEKQKITVRHLLTHSAGLYKWKPTYYPATNSSEQYEYIANLPLDYPVGEERHYSDLGFMLLGEIIHRVAGLPLDRYLEGQLYRPLGLEHSLFNPLEHNIPKKRSLLPHMVIRSRNRWCTTMSSVTK